MRLKLTVLMVLVLLLVVVGNVRGTTRTWDHGGADRLWKTAGNWSSDTVPTSADYAQIVDTGSDKPIINSDHTGANAARCYDLRLGYNAGTSGEAEMTGGELICNSRLQCGYNGTGTFTMSGGSIAVTTYDVDIGAAVSGTGSVFNMSGGTINSARYFYVGHLSAGTFNMSGGLVTATGGNTIIGQGASGGNYGTINISAGTIDTTGQLIRLGYNTRGIINMTGGRIEAGDLHVPYSDSYSGQGDVNLHGGLINTAAFWMGSNGYMDIQSGTLIIDGNVTSTINSYVLAGKIKGYGGNGLVNISYNTPNAGKTTVTAASMTNASNPNPADGAINVDTDTDLNWSAGFGATSHDVYLGTIWADVNSATTASSVFKGNRTDAIFDPGTLVSGKTYYWRIDEKNGSTYKGDVWSFTTQTTSLTLENSAYKLALDQDFDVFVKNKNSNTTSTFTTQFTVIYNAVRPTLSSTSDLTATWKSAGKNLFGTGTNTNIEAVNAEIIDNNIVLTYPAQTNFDLTAWLDLSTDYNEPALRYTLKAKNAGWFMLGYTGAPETDPNTMEKFHQPTMWGDGVIKPPDAAVAPAFPTTPKFCQEFLCPLPAVMTRDVNGVDCAVVVSPDYQSFRLPHYKNVEFGICIRNLDGKAQPMIFSPEMGAQEANLPTDKDSYLAVDATHSFGVLLAVDNSKWYDFYKGIVKNIFKFRDQRDNTGTGSLNTFLANITDYAMDADGNNYNMWDSNQKCNEYLTDQAYSFKILGGLFAINSAIVLDNNEMFWSRSLPQVEYALSREAEGFHPYDYNYNTQMTYNNNMNGPWMSGIELGNLYRLTGGRTKAFEIYSKEKGHNNQQSFFYESLEWYRLYGDSNELTAADYRRLLHNKYQPLPLL